MAASAGVLARRRSFAPVVREAEHPYGQGPRLLDRVRERIRTRHYSRRTEKAYVGWIRRYILFHGRRHPREMGAEELSRFLSSLAVDAKVSASTQNQALAALLFLYREVLGQDVPWLQGVVRAKQPRRLPVVGPSNPALELTRMNQRNRAKRWWARSSSPGRRTALVRIG
jgi:hypothetical protein